MENRTKEYISKVKVLLDQIVQEETPNILLGATMLADALEGDGRIFIWGSTHSSTALQDIYMRAGGLMVINTIFIPGLEDLHLQPFGITSKIERLSGIAEIALDYAPIRPGDVLIVVSVSGRNSVPIEMAKIAHERGIKVIAVTGLRYSTSVSSRHSSGKNMFFYADVVLDNKAEPGDAILTSEKIPTKFCPISGITSVAILQCLIAETVEELLARNITPPIFMAQNLDEGDKYNQTLLKKYQEKIFYLKPD
ncbi:MAG: SIS domain-containing protein [Clostridiaceae bacterium]|nr:SIS domain-containing protein [Clostridiaceae bacterium]